MGDDTEHALDQATSSLVQTMDTLGKDFSCFLIVVKGKSIGFFEYHNDRSVLMEDGVRHHYGAISFKDPQEPATDGRPYYRDPIASCKLKKLSRQSTIRTSVHGRSSSLESDDEILENPRKRKAQEVPVPIRVKRILRPEKLKDYHGKNVKEHIDLDAAQRLRFAWHPRTFQQMWIEFSMRCSTCPGSREIHGSAKKQLSTLNVARGNTSWSTC